MGDAVLQPGTADGGADPTDRIATLARFVEIGFAADSENRVDGAIAAPVEPPSSQVVWNTRDIGAETPARQRSVRSEEHTSELQSLMRISYAVFCLKKKKQHNTEHKHTPTPT